MKIGNRPIRNTTREEVMNNRFGTTSDMIIQTVQEKEGCACLAIDEKGLYLTSPAYVDRPLPIRTATPETVKMWLPD